MKKKIIICLLIVLIIVAALVIVFLYFATDTFKTDKELFFKYLSKTELIDNGFIHNYKDIIKKEELSNYSSSGNITLSKASNSNQTSVANVQPLFNIKYNNLRNKNLNQDYADYTLSSNNEDIATVRYLRDDKLYGIKIENVLKKYLAIENNNLKEFYNKLGVENFENVPDYIATVSLIDLFNIDENQRNIIKSTYGNLFINNLTNDNFAKSNDGDNTVIKLSLTEREFYNILKQELETLKTDNNTLNIIINKANTLGYKLSYQSLTSYIQKQIDSINSTNITDEQFINIAITVNNKNVMKIDTIIYENKQGITGDGKEECLLSIDISQNNKMVLLIKDSNNTYKLNMTYGFSDDKLWNNIDIVSTDDQTNTDKEICGVKHQINNSQNRIISDFTANINLSETNNTIQININEAKELKQDIQIEKITTENSEILNNKSKEELQNLLNAIVQRIQFVYGSKLEDYLSIIQSIEM